MEAIDTLAIFGLPSPNATSAHSGVSPSNSSAEDYDIDIQDEDHGDMFASMLGSHDEQSLNEDGTKKRSRRPPSTAAKRATHNAVERARRESLNGRFMELAHVLPNMSMSKRPSKNSVVEHAIEYVGQAERRDKAITKENDSLLTELNELRAKLGMPARPALEPIVEAPTGKPPSKRPSTIQNPSGKPKAAAKAPAAPAPVVSAVAQSSGDISPRTMTPVVAMQAPVVMPGNPYAQPNFDWTATQFDTFNVNAFDPSLYGAQPSAMPFHPACWPVTQPYVYMPHPTASIQAHA